MRPERARGFARLAIAAVVVAVVVILIANSNDSELIIFGSTPSYPHQLQITAPSAFEAMAGERVVEGGVGVGTILSTNVTKQAQAHVVIGLSNTAWPVPTDSRFTLRLGGTIKFTDRFISISKGSATADFSDNATIPAKQFTVPVEFDSLFNIFNRQTRTSLKAFFDNGGPTLKAAQQSFRRALEVAPLVLGQADHVFQDLSYNQAALSTLVRSTAQVSDAVAASNPGVRTLITGAANTFATVASESKNLDRVLVMGHDAFQDLGTGLLTLAHTTVPRLTTVLRRISPGLTQLNDLASPLNSALGEVVNIEPTAVDTLDTVKNSGPSLDTFLTDARTSLLPQLQSVSAQAAVEVNCIRPYTPDAISFLQGWASFLGDGLINPHVHVLHALIDELPFPNDSPLNSTQIHSIFPGIHVTFPDAPGTSWNQPWYQPQCGITQAADAVDPELGTYDQQGTKIFPYNSTSPTYAPAPHPN